MNIMYFVYPMEEKSHTKLFFNIKQAESYIEELKDNGYSRVFFEKWEGTEMLERFSV